MVRAFVEKKLDRVQSVSKFFYHGSMFRYERPQKGRLREFHQFGCEVFKEDSVYEDANLIIMMSHIFNELKIKYRIEINSLGCNECITPYKDKLISFLDKNKTVICQDCTRRKDTNPIRTLDCKNDNCQKIYTDAPLITDNLCSNCSSDFLKLQQILDNNGISYVINKKLVRGLDYYTKTAFEFISDDIGAKSAIAGGGRYDKLVEFLGGRTTPAVGFAIGIERIFDLIKLPDNDSNLLYFGAMCEDGVDVVFKKSSSLVDAEIFCEYKIKGFNAHMKNAMKKNAKYCILVGEDELKNNTLWVKNLKTKEEKTIEINNLIIY